jgi:GT2 family glycosyltransferase
VDENISEPSPDDFDPTADNSLRRSHELPGDQGLVDPEHPPLGPDATEDEWWSTTAALLIEPDQLLADADAVDQPIEGQLDLIGSSEFDDEVSVEQTTEWFTFDDEAEPEPLLPRRHHHVTAVVVTHNGGTWLPAVMSTLASQTRPADGAVGVDTGSTDNSAAVLRATLGLDRVITTANEGFGHAVRTGLERVGRIEVQEGDEFAELITWVWLLHDDSAPDSGCLEALLNTADDNPSASILGPKILGWHDRRLLLEVGVSITGAGRRYTGLERGEHDQGQHDGVRDVMSVSSAGMLVRRDVWELLQGFDPQVPFFRDDLDFCWRAHRAGERVIIATDAVMHHREASAHDDVSAPAAMRPSSVRIALTVRPRCTCFSRSPVVLPASSSHFGCWSEVPSMLLPISWARISRAPAMRSAQFLTSRCTQAAWCSRVTSMATRPMSRSRSCAPFDPRPPRSFGRCSRVLSALLRRAAPRLSPP